MATLEAFCHGEYRQQDNWEHISSEILRLLVWDQGNIYTRFCLNYDLYSSNTSYLTNGG